MCDFVWIVYMISASNCQTPYKKLTRIVKARIIINAWVPIGCRGWKIESFNEDFFEELLALGDFGEAVRAPQIVKALTKVCDGAMPRRKLPNGRRPPMY